MSLIQTILNVSDNSGGKKVKCIKILGSNNKNNKLASMIYITLSRALNSTKVKKRVIYLGLVISIKNYFMRFDGTIVKFFFIKTLIFSKQFKFLGTRIYGLIPKEIKIKVKQSAVYPSTFKKNLSLIKAFI